MSDFFNSVALFFSYSFVQRAMIAGSLISLCAALLGVSLVLKRYSMIGDGLSHVGFGALAVAAALNLTDIALVITIPIVIAAAFLLLHINRNSHINSDAAIAVISTVSLAAGYIIMYKNGTNIDVGNYMFGNILTLSSFDTVASIILCVIVILIFVLLYHRIFAVTFDEAFSKAIGIKAGVYNTVIAILTAVVVVLGMRMMGTLLISALIIFPSLISMKLGKSFFSVVLISGGISLVCFFAGLITAFCAELPPGSAIVVLYGIILLGVSVIKRKITAR
ncbi:MAG: metal ABC transporter permease [Acutalibacteraceae bacterium]|nr:metal ABC transporter permease [Acutalibacteraceae bacterium]